MHNSTTQSDARPELEKAYGYRELQQAGLGSPVTIWRKQKRRVDPFPAPDFYDGKSPRWFASTVQAWLNALPKSRAEALRRLDESKAA